MTDGFTKGKRQFGIYEVDDTTYKLCLSPKKDGERPKEFASKPNSENVIEILKKVKK